LILHKVTKYLSRCYSAICAPNTRCLLGALVAFSIFFSPIHPLANEAPADRSGIEQFTRHAEYESVRISPKGTYLAVTQRDGPIEKLIVLDRHTMKPLLVTHYGKGKAISNMRWASEDIIIIQPAERFPNYVDYEVSTGEIYALNIHTNRSKNLYGYRAGQFQTGSNVKRQESTNAAGKLLSILPENPDRILIQSIGYSSGEFNFAATLDLNTGRLRKIARSPVRDGYFYLDEQNRVVMVVGTNDKNEHEVYYRKDGKGDFVLRYSRQFQEGEIYPISHATNKPGFFLSVDSSSHGTEELLLWNPETQARESLFRHPIVDISWVLLTPRRTPWAARYDDHYPKYVYPDPKHPLVDVHRQLLASFPTADVSMTSVTDDLSVAIVYVSGPKDPGMYYVLDVPAKKIVAKIATRSWIDTEQLVDMQPIEVAVRDGTKVRGFLSLPDLPDKRSKDLPLVVVVHGGPHGVADRWGYDSEAQLFAAQGYAVVQVNFRGSDGRGRSFEAAGYGRWGREMQDDVTDVVRFLIDDGTVDPERICIYGGSYGAYAALTGAYRTPDLYQCAIGVAGVYDLPMMFKRGDVRLSRSGHHYLKVAVGTDKAEMQDRSPTYNADKITAKVMLVHGAKDERAPLAQAQRMRRQLIKAGNEPRWLLEKREGHGFIEEQNRLNMYTQVLEFLDENLGHETDDETCAGSCQKTASAN